MAAYRHSYAPYISVGVPGALHRYAWVAKLMGYPGLTGVQGTGGCNELRRGRVGCPRRVTRFGCHQYGTAGLV